MLVLAVYIVREKDGTSSFENECIMECFAFFVENRMSSDQKGQV